jgi:hypothetical protein
MRVRSIALQWYKKRFDSIDASIYTSKLYQPHESWPRSMVWFIEIPIKVIDDISNKKVHLLCQKEVGGHDFYHLIIPTAFFRKNRNGFATNKNKISLFLSADAGSYFIDKRGSKQIVFKQFIQ